jgi:hypothetical protein
MCNSFSQDTIQGPPWASAYEAPTGRKVGGHPSDCGNMPPTPAPGHSDDMVVDQRCRGRANPRLFVSWGCLPASHYRRTGHATNGCIVSRIHSSSPDNAPTEVFLIALPRGLASSMLHQIRSHGVTGRCEEMTGPARFSGHRRTTGVLAFRSRRC